MTSKFFWGPLRLGLLLASTAQIIAASWWMRMRNRGPLSDRQRADWQHWSGQMIARRLGIELQITGTVPTQGLIVSNHLSYLDILLYAAAFPCAMVGKLEVRNWPLFGLAARCGGTVFLDRGRAASAVTASEKVSQLLASGIPVLLFPEGTTTDGSAVLPFRSSIFAPAARSHFPIQAAAIRYVDGADYREKDICYYADIHFAPHLLQTMALGPLSARITFAAEPIFSSDRKAAASSIWCEVVELRQQTSDRTMSPVECC